MGRLKQNTAPNRIFSLGATGLTVNIQLSKAGAALTDPSVGAANLGEIGRGLYYFSLTSTDTDTVGNLGYALTDAATNTTIYGTGDCVDSVEYPDAFTCVYAASDITGSTNTTVSNASMGLLAGSFVGCLIMTLTPGGNYQLRTIVSVVQTSGSNATITVDRAWDANPSNSTWYYIFTADNPKLDSSLDISTGATFLTAADVWTYGTRVLTAATNITSTGGTVTVSAGAVTVGTNNDKTGYSLSQSFPANFSALAIDGSGRIDVGKILGTASAGAAGYVGVDWGHVNAPTTTVALTGTTISSSQVAASVSGAVGSISGVSFPSNFGALSISSAGRVKIQSGITTNTALNNFEFVMYNATDHISPMTGLTITAQRSIDGGSFASCANAAVEIGSGVYAIDLANTDVNGAVILLKFSAGGADNTYATLITTP